MATLQAHVEVRLTSSAPTANYYEIVSPLTPATNIISLNANWEDYKDLLDLLGEANGPLISNNEVKLRVLTQISTGENLLIYEGFYLDGRVPLGGGIDESFRRAVWIFIISRSRQLAESSRLSDRSLSINLLHLNTTVTTSRLSSPQNCVAAF